MDFLEMKNPSYLTHILNIVLAYIIGIVAANIILLPFTGLIAVAFIVGGIIISLPLLLITLLIVRLFKNNIEKNLKVWCSSAVILVPIVWLVMEYATSFSNEFDIVEYLSLRHVWERAFLATLCACSSSAFYYHRMTELLSNQKAKENP